MTCPVHSPRSGALESEDRASMQETLLELRLRRLNVENIKEELHKFA